MSYSKTDEKLTFRNLQI